VVVKGDNNVYVGKDGEVYRRTSSGTWQQYDGAQWSGAASRVDPGTIQDLNRDAAMRASGASQASQSQSWRRSGGSAGGSRGGGDRGGVEAACAEAAVAGAAVGSNPMDAWLSCQLRRDVQSVVRRPGGRHR